MEESNLGITGALEREGRTKGAEKLFKEIMADRSPNLVRNLDIQIYEAQKSPKRFSSKRFSPKWITIKLSKIKESFKTSKTNTNLTYKRTPRRITADFSAEALQVRRE